MCPSGPFNFRSGADVHQSIRVTTTGMVAGGLLTPNNTAQAGIAAYNSVTNNTDNNDISVTVRDTTSYPGLPYYHSGNVSTNGQVWLHGPPEVLATDPNQN